MDRERKYRPLTIDEIRAYINDGKGERERRERLFDYYRGAHKIRTRVLKDPTKPNNRLEHGFPSFISNAYTGYMFGSPISYTADDALLAALQQSLNYNDEQAENSLLGLDLSICGAAVEIHYLDADAEPRFRRVDPTGCIAITDNTIEDKLTALIRCYDETDVVTRRVTHIAEVYDAGFVSTYRSGGGASFELVEQKPHSYGDVPAVVYYNNGECMGDFEGVITLIDAYDLMQSESLNDQEYFSDAYLKLRGVGEMDGEQVAAMKGNRILLLPDSDMDAEWLVKTQSDQLVENIKNRLNTDIHRFSGCPDMSDESFAGNASGVAIRYKLLQFENVTGIKEREFKRGLQRRIELLCNIWRVLGRGAFDWRGVQIKFKRSLPQNLLELSQTLSNLGSVISDETKRSLLPLDIEEEIERARIEEQRKAGMALFAAPEGYEELMTDGDE